MFAFRFCLDGMDESYYVITEIRVGIGLIGSSTSKKHTLYVPSQSYSPNPHILPRELRLDSFALSRLQILDELIIAGELQESSKKSVLRVVRPFPFPPFSLPSPRLPSFLPSSVTTAPSSYSNPSGQHQVTQSDSVEEQENSEDTMARLGSRALS